MKRKQIPPDIIHDLTGLVEFRVIARIYDGTRRKRANLYLVEIRGISAKGISTGKTRRIKRRTPTESTCVLKIFPNALLNQLDYKNEVAANTELCRSTAALTPEDAVNAMLGPVEAADVCRWPQCYGTIRVGAKVSTTGWSCGDGSQHACNGILMEYIPGLELLTKDDVTEDLGAEIMQLLEDLHTLKVLHRDHMDHSIWPEIGFCNLFLHPHPPTGRKELIILDFDKARVLGNTARDKVLFEEELERMDEMLLKILSGKDWVDSVPKEVQKLLDNR